LRAFTQDDGHIFCTEDQITDESVRFWRLPPFDLQGLRFEDVVIKSPDRPAVRAGSDEVWDKAEGSLRAAIEATGLPYTMNPGEGAFYGPKLRIRAEGCHRPRLAVRHASVDFVLPERLDASYIGEDGQKHRPVMLHRAILARSSAFSAC